MALALAAAFPALGQELPPPGSPAPWLRGSGVVAGGPDAAPALPAVSTAALTADVERLRAMRGVLDRVLREAPRLKALEARFDEDRKTARRLWASGLDGLIAADSVLRRWRPLCGQEPALLCLASLSLQLRWAAEWTRAADAAPSLLQVLDARDSEEGLPGGAYTRLKESLLSQDIAGVLARAPLKPAEKAAEAALGRAAARELSSWVRADMKRLAVKTGRAKGPAPAWTPWTEGWVKEDPTEYAVSASSWCFTPESLYILQRDMRPGDIVLLHPGPGTGQLGVPGFWTRAALYIGDGGERRRLFKSDDLDAAALRDHPEAYHRSLEKSGHCRTALVTGPVWPGSSVVAGLGSLEEASRGGTAAVLRPRRPLAARARAVARAFESVGRPAASGAQVAARAWDLGTDVPANAFVQLFDAEFGLESRTFDLVGALEGFRAMPVEDFRRSWRRPKWDFIQQQTSGGRP